MTKRTIEKTEQLTHVFISDLFKLCESRLGNWHYHLCKTSAAGDLGLCGAKTMPCHATNDTWGYKPSHMRTRYCVECEKLASQITEQK